jgi:hypothetical protein
MQTSCALACERQSGHLASVDGATVSPWDERTRARAGTRVRRRGSAASECRDSDLQIEAG